MSGQLLPCPCGGTPAVAYRAQGHDTHFAVCRACGRKGKDKTTGQAAIVAWNESARIAAEAAERRAARVLRQRGGELRRDPTFIDAVVSRFLRVGPLNGGDHNFHVMRLAVDGVDREVNVRAFVDGHLAHQWPVLLELVDPEALVHRVLREAGHAAFAMEGKTKGPNKEAWVRAAPQVGAPVDVGTEAA